MCVEPSHRRRGLAARMMSTLMAFARDEGVHRIFLTTPAFNRAAAAVYERAGFSILREFVLALPEALWPRPPFIDIEMQWSDVLVESERGPLAES